MRIFHSNWYLIPTLILSILIVIVSSFFLLNDNTKWVGGDKVFIDSPLKSPTKPPANDPIIQQHVLKILQDPQYQQQLLQLQKQGLSIQNLRNRIRMPLMGKTIDSVESFVIHVGDEDGGEWQHLYSKKYRDANR